jgi:hypothetical protein
MITNATITRIDTATISAGGEKTWVNGSSISLRCCVDEPTTAQRWTLGSTIASSTSVVYLLHETLTAAAVTAPAVGQRLIISLDSGTQLSQIVEKARERIKDGSLSHYELFVKTL